METEPGTTAPSVIAISWLAAAVAVPLTLVGTACGQGLGAVLGRCHWIGVTIPLDRQVWALVNQPVLNFSSLGSASGYWLGSVLLPLVTAIAIIGFLPRTRSLVTEFVCLQIAWAMSTISIAWLPLIDAGDGHLIRYLSLHGWPTGLVWGAPILAAVIVLLPTLRLLEIARRRHPNIKRFSRVLVVTFHLAIPTIVWVCLASLVRGSVPVFPMVAIALPLISAVVFAWFRYPSPYVHPLDLPRTSGIVGLLAVAVFLSAGVWFAGRPMPGGDSAGILWGQPHSFNNIRPWVEPHSVTRENPDN